MVILAQGVREMAQKYTQAVDDAVFKFLESEGYKVNRDKRGAKELQKQLKAEGKTVSIKTTNQVMEKTVEGLKYTFDLEIKFKEDGGAR